MSRSLILSFESAAARYHRLAKKIRKSIQRGEFWRFAHRKRQHLLRKLENLRRRLGELSLQAKLGTTGIAMAALLASGAAEGQTTKLGPFVESPLKNPLPPPAFTKHLMPSVSLVDFDNDGDADAVIGDNNGGLTYFENTGTSKRANFTERPYSLVFDFYFSDPTSYMENVARTAFSDVDDDGDYDMVVMYQTTNYTSAPDLVYFYRNDAGPGKRPHFVDPGNDPFSAFSVESGGWPAFTDIDQDGDKDLVVTGNYFSAADDEYGFLQVFRNDKIGHEPNLDATFNKINGFSNNPLYLPANLGYVSISFSDMDGDGDEDFIFTPESQMTRYRRNDNGTFVEQTGDYVYNAQNPGQSTGNPFSVDALTNAGLNNYRSIGHADLDNDGDLDVVAGVAVAGASNVQSSYVFLENRGNGYLAANNTTINPIMGFLAGYNSDAFHVDYDGDGDNDIVTVGEVETATCDEYLSCEGYGSRLELRVFLNDGQNRYTQIPITVNPFPADMPPEGKIILADIDADGDLDMTVSYYTYVGYSQLYHVAYYQKTPGGWVKQAPAVNPFQFVETEDLEAPYMDFGDLTGDGKPDMVMYVNGQMRAYQNVGSGSLPAFSRALSWETGFESQPYGIAIPKMVDLDNDGDLDILVGKYEFLWYYENIGTPTVPSFKQWFSGNDPKFSAGNPFAAFGQAGTHKPAVADIDDDGDLDLLYSYYDGSFGFLENTNPSPVVTSSNTTLQLTIGQGTVLDPSITLTDPDGDLISRIIVTIAPFEPGQEKLQLIGSHPNLSAAFDPVKGTLTITPINKLTATVSDFQAALRSIEYTYGSTGTGRKGSKADASTHGRSLSKNITFYSLDADLTVSTSNTTQFTLSKANLAPVITPGTSSISFNKMAVLALPTITLADGDDANLTSATILFTNGYDASSDRLQYSLAGPIAFNFDQATGTATLTGAASVAQYEAALKAVYYNNLNPTASGSRQLQVQVNDGETNSNVQVVTVALNALPVLAPTTINQTYSSGTLALFNSITASDDGTSLVSARIGIDTGYVSTEDRLVFLNQNGITGNFNQATGVLALTGTATVGQYESAIRSITYNNLGTTTRTKQLRYLNLTVNDGAGNSNVSTVVLGMANLAPVASGTATPFYLTGEVVVNSNIVIGDSDDFNLSGATVVITNGLSAGEDELLFTTQNGITGTYTPANGTLTLTGSSSSSNYQAALRSVRYRNNSSTPNTADRSFTFTVTDGVASTSVAGTVMAINKPPVITGENKQTAAGGNIALSTGQILSDPDNNLDLSTLVVTSKQGASVTISNGIVTIDYNSVPTYKGTDELTITVCDTAGRCRTSTITVEVGADPLIYTGMSPNGDGVNDWFQIEFVPEQTQVSIYNRWGDIVFETDSYSNNEPSRRFEGKNKNGTDVISGSYFYKIRYPDGRVRTGYLLLNR